MDADFLLIMGNDLLWPPKYVSALPLFLPVSDKGFTNLCQLIYQSIKLIVYTRGGYDAINWLLSPALAEKSLDFYKTY